MHLNGVKISFWRGISGYPVDPYEGWNRIYMLTQLLRKCKGTCNAWPEDSYMDCPLTHSFISCLLALTSSGRELPTFC